MADWRFLFLLVFSSLLDYSIGLALARTARTGTRKALPGLSLAANLGLLGVFKYFNFFIENFTAAFSFLKMIFSRSILTIPPFGPMVDESQTLLLIGALLVMEWMGQQDPFALSRIGLKWKRPARWFLYAFILIQVPLPLSSRNPSKRDPFRERMRTFGPCLDANDLIKLDPELHFYDTHHLNQAGVIRFNQALIQQLSPDGQIPDILPD